MKLLFDIESWPVYFAKEIYLINAILSKDGFDLWRKDKSPTFHFAKEKIKEEMSREIDEDIEWWSMEQLKSALAYLLHSQKHLMKEKLEFRRLRQAIPKSTTPTRMRGRL